MSGPTRTQKRWSGRLRTLGALLALLGGVATADRLFGLRRGNDDFGPTGPASAPLWVGLGTLGVGGAIYAHRPPVEPMKRPASARAAVQQLMRALLEGDADAAALAIHFPYTHLGDFRGRTTLQVYDAARFQEALRERAAGPPPRPAATELVVEALSDTAAIVRERTGETTVAAHTVIKQGASWRVVASWYAQVAD